MAQLLYDIDTKAVASKAYKDDEYMSPDYACHETPVHVETYSNEVGWQIE